MIKYIFLILTSFTFAQLQVNLLEPVKSIDNYYEATLSITLNSTPITLDSENILVLESQRSGKVLSLLPNETNYVLRWLPSYSSIEDGGGYFADIFVVLDDGQLATANIELADADKPLCAVFTINGRQNELRIGTSGRVDASLDVRLLREDEATVSIDSLTSTFDNIFNVWIGSSEEFTHTLPFDAPKDSYLFFTRLIEDYSEGPFLDKLVVHYDKGGELVLPVISGRTSVPRETELEITFPNNGEIYAPCDTVEVRWTPFNPRFGVELSVSNALNQEYLGITRDSLFRFKLPAHFEDNAVIRVAQNSDQTIKDEINIGNNKPEKIDLTSDASEFILAYNSGNVHRYDGNTNQLLGIINKPINEDFFEIRDIKYYSNEGYIIQFIANNKNYLAYYDFTQNSYLWTKVIKFNLADKIRIDDKNGIVLYSNQFDNELRRFSVLNGDELTKFTYYDYVSTFDINYENNLIVVAFFNGDLRIYNLESNEEISRFDFTGFRYIHTLDIAPNGKYVGLSFKSNNIGSVNCWILDLESNSIINTFEASTDDPIDMSFSPSSNFMIVASNTNPKVVTYDLVNFSKSTDLVGGTGTVVAASFAEDRPVYVFAPSIEQEPLTKLEFVYPEVDFTDQPIQIITPEILDTNIVIEEYPIYTTTNHQIEDIIQNLGPTNLLVEDVYMSNGRNFRINTQSNKFKLLVDQSNGIEFQFTPKQLGRLTDTIIVETCTRNYLIPVIGFSREFDLSFEQNPIDFGDVCVGFSDTLNFDLFVNNEQFDFMFNNLSFDDPFNQNFTILDYEVDKVIQTGQFLNVTIIGKVNSLGIARDSILIFHDGQESIYRSIPIQINGIGTEVGISNTEFPFIPEQPSREFTITNDGNVPIEIINLLLDSKGNFELELDQQLPIQLEPNQSFTGQINWITLANHTEATLFIDTDPCAIVNNLPVGPWDANVFFIGNSIIANGPADEIRIPIQITTNSQFEYGADVDFESILLTNPRLFFPIDIETKYNFAEFENLGINDDGLRETRIRVNGNFPKNDTIAYLIGVTGIAETDRTDYLLGENSLGFSRNINLNSGTGEIIIDNIYNDRRILHPQSTITIEEIFPNPAQNQIKLSLNSMVNQKASIMIFDNKAQLVHKVEKIDLIESENIIDLDLSQVKSGNYHIEIKTNNESVHSSLNIIK